MGKEEERSTYVNGNKNKRRMEIKMRKRMKGRRKNE